MAVILNVWAVFIFSKIFTLSDGIFCYYVYFHRCEWPNIEQIITHLATLVKCVTRQVYQTIVVVAQLVERSFPIPEVCGLNPDIGKYLYILNIC